MKDPECQRCHMPLRLSSGNTECRGCGDPITIASILEHPCKETCSGWKQGFEKGRADIESKEKFIAEQRQIIHRLTNEKGFTMEQLCSQNIHLDYLLRQAHQVMKGWHDLGMELCEAESEKNETRRAFLKLRPNEHEISGNFRLNRAWRAFAEYELKFKEVFAKITEATDPKKRTHHKDCRDFGCEFECSDLEKA